jgi:hypothetical protein
VVGQPVSGARSAKTGEVTNLRRLEIIFSSVRIADI